MRSGFGGCIASAAFAVVLSLPAALRAGPVAELPGASTVDLGEFPTEDSRTGVFRIRNAGDSPLRIVRFRVTCGGCVEVSPRSAEVPPGSTLQLRATTVASSLLGTFRKTLFVETDDPQRKVLRFVLTGDARPTTEKDVEKLRKMEEAARKRAETVALHDTDGNGRLDDAEVRRMARKRILRWDRNGNGRLEPAELKAMADAGGVPAEEPVAE